MRRSSSGDGACAAGNTRSAGAPALGPLMGKRRGEPLVCHAPSKRPMCEPPPPARAAAPERRSRGEGATAPKRKLEEAEAPPGKRPRLRSSPRGEQGDAGGRRRRRGGSAAPQDEQTAEGRAGGRGKERAAVAEQEEEEFCQYNSFLYWRVPLPTVDLSDIQNLHEETPPEAKTPSRTDTMETEMET